MKSRVVQITESQKKSLDLAIEEIVKYDSMHTGIQYRVESVLADGFWSDGNDINVTIKTIPSDEEISKVAESMRIAFVERYRKVRWFSIGMRGGYKNGYHSISLFHILRQKISDD